MRVAAGKAAGKTEKTVRQPGATPSFQSVGAVSHPSRHGKGWPCAVPFGDGQIGSARLPRSKLIYSQTSCAKPEAGLPFRSRQVGAPIIVIHPHHVIQFGGRHLHYLTIKYSTETVYCARQQFFRANDNAFLHPTLAMYLKYHTATGGNHRLTFHAMVLQACSTTSIEVQYLDHVLVGVPQQGLSAPRLRCEIRCRARHVSDTSLVDCRLIVYDRASKHRHTRTRPCNHAPMYRQSFPGVADPQSQPVDIHVSCPHNCPS